MPANADGSVTVTPAEPFTAVFVWRTADTVTVGGFGMPAGALYRPLAVIVPITALPPAIPFTCQFTPEVEFCTPALNWTVPFSGTLQVGGATVMVKGGGTAAITVMLA